MAEDEKTVLLHKCDELRARLVSIEKDFRAGLDPDAEERAIQLENREVLEGIAKAAEEELARIEKKLAEL
jgi:RNA polymerase-binding transcription factor DksA